MIRDSCNPNNVLLRRDRESARVTTWHERLHWWVPSRSAGNSAPLRIPESFSVIRRNYYGEGGKREIESKRRRGRREKERKELLSLLNMKMFSYLITIYVCSIDGQYCRDRCDVPLCKCYITYSSRAGIDVCIDFENV